MLFNSLNLVQGSEVQSTAVDSGTDFPQLPVVGQLFYYVNPDPVLEGLYVYSGVEWVKQLNVTNDAGLLLQDVIQPGTYKSVTVSSKGIVIDGTNPTTLAGYGITDAQPKNTDLTAIANITGTAGILKKVGAGSWILDNSPAITENQTITLTGDASGSGKTGITVTLANSGVGAGTYGSTSSSPVIAVDSKGRITSASSTQITLDASAVVSGTLSNSRISQASVTQHQSALSIAESQIAIGSILARLNKNQTITGIWSFDHPITGSLDGTATTASSLATARTIGVSGDASWSVSFDGSSDVAGSLTLANTGVAAATYSAADSTPSIEVDSKGRIVSISLQKVAIDTSAVTSGTFDNSRISQSSVTQHQAALSIAESQIPAGAFPNSRTSQSAVTQHQAALSITESQIVDGTIYPRISADETITGNWTFASPINASFNGVATSADKLTTARNISISGDAAWTVSFDGSQNVSGNLTLSNSGVNASTYGSASAVAVVAVDSKGRITSASTTNISIDTSAVTSGTFANARISQSSVTQYQAFLSISESQITNGTLLARVADTETISGAWTFTSAPIASGANLYSIPNAALTNSSITLGTTNIALGATAANISGLTSVSSASFTGELTGNSSTATALKTPRNISIIGDATWTVLFDGTSNVSNSLTLATVNSSPQADTFRKVTVNGKGLVTATSAVTPSDITTALAFTPVNKAGDTMTGPLILSGNPTQDFQAATKKYVDQVAQGVVAKPAAKAATTTNLANATYQNGTSGIGATLTSTVNGAWPGLDGVTTGWAIYDGVLVKNQTNQAQNGRYYVSDLGSATTPWVLTRCTYCDEANEIPGSYIFVQAGTQAATGWVLIVDNPSTFVVGTDAIRPYQFSGAGQIVAGTGLSKDGNTLSIANTTVTAASYGSASSVATFTVNAQGQLTGAANATIAITSAQVSGLAASATTDTTNASNISSGTLSAGRLPAFSGDATSSAGSSVLTLANSGVTAGTYNNSATAVSPITVDSKGRITNVGVAVTVTPAFSSITGKPTTVSGYGITDAVKTTDNTINLTNASTSSVTLTTTTTTANQVLDAVSASSFRTLKYIVQVTSGTSYQATEFLIIHDGTTARGIEYATLTTASSLATFNVDISGGNIRFLVTPVNASTTFKAFRTAINI